MARNGPSLDLREMSQRNKLAALILQQKELEVAILGEEHRKRAAEAALAECNLRIRLREQEEARRRSPLPAMIEDEILKVGAMEPAGG